MDATRVGRSPAALEGPSSAVTGLAWSPDDRRPAAGCENGGVAVFEARSAKP